MGAEGREQHPSGSQRNTLQEGGDVLETDERHEDARNAATSHAKQKAAPKLRRKKVKDSFPGKRMILLEYRGTMHLVTATMKPIRDILKRLTPEALGNYAVTDVRMQSHGSRGNAAVQSSAAGGAGSEDTRQAG